MEPIQLLEQWHTGLRILHHAHTRAAVSFERRSRFLGVPVIIVSTAVGTSIFAGVESSPTLKIIAGLLSFGAAVLSSLQATLKYPEIAVQHKAAAQKYGQLRREIEVLLAVKPEEQTKLTQSLDKFQKEWDTLDDQSPTIPQRIYDRSVEVETSRSGPSRSPSNAVTAKPGETDHASLL
jgi:hypothetical protein